MAGSADSPRRESVAAAQRLRWAAVEWAREQGRAIPTFLAAGAPEFGVDRVSRAAGNAQRLLLLLAMTCELPSGDLHDYSYTDWADVLGITEGEAVEAADILASLELSYRIGELRRPGTDAVLCLPHDELHARVAVTYSC
ncbi:hypothetical protein [Nocardia sp. IFM 10818]